MSIAEQEGLNNPNYGVIDRAIDLGQSIERYNPPQEYIKSRFSRKWVTMLVVIALILVAVINPPSRTSNTLVGWLIAIPIWAFAIYLIWRD